MSRDLRLQIVLNAVDKATSILKKVTGGNQSLAAALKKTHSEKSKLNSTLGDLRNYGSLIAAQRKTTRALAETSDKHKEYATRLEQQQEKHIRLKATHAAALTQYKKLSTALIDGKGNTAEFMRELEKATISLKTAEQSYRTSAETKKKYAGIVRHTSEELKKLTGTQKKQHDQLGPLKQQLESAGINTNKMGENARALKGKLETATTAIAKQKDALAKMNTQLAKQRELQASIKKLHSAGLNVGMHGAGAAFLGKTALSRGADALGPGVDFEATLRDMAITGNLSKADESALGSQIRIDAEKYGQFTDQISSGLSVLVANGITDAKSLNYYSAILAKSSVATNSSMEDLGNMIISLQKNLNLAVGDIPAALDSLAYAGKEGSFEIKDMAKWLPQLSPMMAALGIDGRNAVAELGAAMQIARLGAGDSDTAANNLKNYLSKITAPETIKHFDDAGIDLKARLTELSAKGVSPLQGSLQLITEYMKTKGTGALTQFQSAMKLTNDVEREAALEKLSSAFALGDLFRDMQAMSFIRPAIANSEQMQGIKAGASSANGMIDEDWKKRMETSRKQLDQLQISLDEMKLEAASIILPEINKALPDLIAFVRKTVEWIKADPERAAGIAKWVGGILAALTLLGTLGFVIGNIMVICSGFAAIAALIGAPFLIVILAIAAAAALIWYNWDDLKAKFTQWLSEFNSAWEGGWGEALLFIGKTLLNIGNLFLDWSPIGLFYTHLFQPLMKMFGIDLPEKFTDFGKLMVDSLAKQFSRLPSILLKFLPGGPLLKMGAELLGYSFDGKSDPAKEAIINNKPQVNTSQYSPLVMRQRAATPTSDNISIVINSSTGNERSLAKEIQNILDERDRKKQRQQRANLFDNN